MIDTNDAQPSKPAKGQVRDFLDAIPCLEERQHLDSDIIANNRSYVGRVSRITDAQANAYEKGMQHYGLAHSRTQNLSQMLQNIEYDSLVLDIGFGMGNALVAMADANARANKKTAKQPQDSAIETAFEETSTTATAQELFVGIETFRPGIGALWVQAFAKKLQNIRVFHADAVGIMWNMIEENSIDRIQIFFPDPWPKDRHHKRRLIQKRFLQLCLHILKPSGILWILTDWEDYAEWIDNNLQGCKVGQAEKKDSSAVLQWEFAEDSETKAYLDTLRIATKFENKGIEKGHKINSWVLKKVQKL